MKANELKYLYNVCTRINKYEYVSELPYNVQEELLHDVKSMGFDIPLNTRLCDVLDNDVLQDKYMRYECSYKPILTYAYTCSGNTYTMTAYTFKEVNLLFEEYATLHYLVDDDSIDFDDVIADYLNESNLRAFCIYFPSAAEELLSEYTFQRFNEDELL